jgi:hypothetical protein
MNASRNGLEQIGRHLDVTSGKHGGKSVELAEHDALQGAAMS